ncbi:hypothetical protein DPMN_066930 [Dreissena polymorpha]|uniref:Uncharacterized protein n=1 Tax=Dreissena polymorpha TaxID=45954 RepID=A0A9D4BT88_DREPO|nr:hypothetical protein DPMN_066930 [Dreissena polymorpha]
MGIGLAIAQDREGALRLLEGMVSLAKTQKTKTKGKEDWLKNLSRSLDAYQIVDREWIHENVFPLPQRPKKREQEYNPGARQRDIRLGHAGSSLDQACYLGDELVNAEKLLGKPGTPATMKTLVRILISCWERRVPESVWTSHRRQFAQWWSGSLARTR